MGNLFGRFKNLLPGEKRRQPEAHEVRSEAIATEYVRLLSNISEDKQRPSVTYYGGNVIQFSKLKEGTILRLCKDGYDYETFKWRWIVVGSNEDGKTYLYQLAGDGHKYLSPPKNPAIHICNNNYLVPISNIQTGNLHAFTDFESDVNNLLANIIQQVMTPDEYRDYLDERPVALVEKVDVMWGGLGQKQKQTKSEKKGAEELSFGQQLPNPV